MMLVMKRFIRTKRPHMFWLTGGLLFVLAWPVLVSAALVEIVAGKDISFCEKVAKFFGERLAPDADLLKTVEWKAVELKGQGSKTRHCSSLDKALVDLNNDGRLALVIKTTFCMKGSPRDSFYMFPADSAVLEQANWQDLSPLLATSDKFEKTGVFTVQPFLLDGSAYVSLTDGRAERMVIALYQGGGRFEDRCYLRAAAQ